MTDPEPTIYERHVFVCTAGEWCPAVDGDGLGVHAALKAAAEAASLGAAARVNRSGCFSQCGNGPMVVVYPEGVWYAAVLSGPALPFQKRRRERRTYQLETSSRTKRSSVRAARVTSYASRHSVTRATVVW